MSVKLRKQHLTVLPQNLPTNKTFNLLSIGQRGVGKTVFLVGSYTELQTESSKKQPHKLWFECQDNQVKENVDKILKYIDQTDQYPPPTMKVVNFSFNLKRQSFWGEKTVCHFRWNDIPGEICDVHNSDFRELVFNSHGCCVFIDAYALRHSDAYIQVLENIFEQVMALTSLVYLNGLNYPLAIVLTKYDLLESNAATQKVIKNKLEPLIAHLNTVKARYEIFHSSIPLVRENNTVTLKPKGTAIAFLWLVWELNKIHSSSAENQLLGLIHRIIPGDANARSKNPNGVMQSLFDSNRKLSNQSDRHSSVREKMGSKLGWFLGIGLVGIALLSLLGYQRSTSQIRTGEALYDVEALQQAGKLDKAIASLEQLVQNNPDNIDLRLRLAEQYELTGNAAGAEKTYDQILARQNNNLKALVRKAVLRQIHKDSQGAAQLFEQAEAAAPDALKPQIRTLAKKTLNSSQENQKLKGAKTTELKSD